MEDLLITAQTNCDLRESAENKIKELEENQPEQLLSELLQILNDFHKDYRALSLAAIISYQILQVMTIENNGSDIFFDAVQKSFNLLSHPNDQVAQSASQILAIASSPLIRSNLANNIITDLVSNLNTTNDPRIVHFIITSIEGILKECSLEREQSIPIFESILQISDSNLFTKDVIRALTLLCDEIPIVINQENIFNKIFEIITQSTQSKEYKAESYRFWYKLIKSSFSVFEIFLDFLLSTIESDLESFDQLEQSTIINISMIVERIAKIQISQQKIFINLEKMFKICQNLINIHLLSTPEENPQDEQWGVYQASGNAITSLCRSSGDKIGQFLLENIDNILSNFDDEKHKETCLFLAINCVEESISLSYDHFMTILSTMFNNDSCLRVIFQCLNFIIVFVNRNKIGLSDEEKSGLLQLVEPVASLLDCNDLFIIKISLACLSYLSVFELSPRNEIMELILSKIICDDELVSNGATDALELFFDVTESIDCALASIPFLLQAYREKSQNETYYTNIADSIMFCATTAKVVIEDYAMDIIEALIEDIEQSDTIFEVICYVSGFVNDISQEYLEILHNIFIISLQNIEDEEVYTSRCMNLLDIMKNNNFAIYIENLANILLSNVGTISQNISNDSIYVLSRAVELFPNQMERFNEYLIEIVKSFFENFDQSAENQTISVNLNLLSALLSTHLDLFIMMKEFVFSIIENCKEIAYVSGIVCSDLMSLYRDMILCDKDVAKEFILSHDTFFKILSKSFLFNDDCYEIRNNLIFLLEQIEIDVSEYVDISEEDEKDVAD
ncbi:hypothetical protein TVAG_058230 [Trichomonas vaginalis G3]|uniref:Importin N-terminal domain-containing protein n=1 Tax=Trichomonas vaginalis (strain ATCC PRA-98 / G3) TaxID=412133 RepID=A2EQ83_TRIV3|nr:armadillo (ARM) repeat-containing protein family [Trichomonas vaginalis G3]EAY05166.1 hypothetical protein TVAG_058230 [Trichomonas vaginalis G3]KAI5522935.1 armadillo (ARM) repeat-containing protein family [Trichomonas vaginalis G3]|eukprot:XP_001317389.1 hypothetical protein [Trichomonas vaginalis G3]